ncbi:MAG: GNAT family N-acetyltransferase [bacterium]|nr:GNAT family N-acetyltransferase [bacterium]
MPVAEGLRHQLLRLVPDQPVWIEARAALLDPGSRLFGDPRGFVIRSDDLRLGAVVGEASESLVREALADIPDAGSDPSALWAVVVPEGFTPEVRSALRDWTSDEADIFREPQGGVSPPMRPSEGVRRMSRAESSLLEGLSEALASELSEALVRSEVVAAWVDARPVSFCHVACESERLWDVSINTAAEYRRRGLAAECVAWLAAEMRDRGKRAVWGAHSENVASRRLALKLGFEPSGRLCLFENEREENRVD